MRLSLVPVLVSLLANIVLVGGEAEQAPAPKIVEETAQTAPAPAATWTMPAEQKAAILKLCDQAIAAGFPDPTGGTFVYGAIKITVTEKEGNSSSSESNSYNGLHLRLADGSFLINLRSLVKNSDVVRLDASKVTDVPIAEIAGLAKKEQRNPRGNADLNDMMTEQLKLFAPEDHDKVRTLYQHMSLIELAQGQSTDLASATLVMMRMEVPQAEIIATACAMNALWNHVGSDFYKGVPTTLTLREEDRWARLEADYEEVQKKSNLRLPNITDIMRMGLAGIFIGQLVKFNEDEYGSPNNARIRLPPEKAGAAALALLEGAEGDLTVVRHEIERMKQRALIKENVPKNAPLDVVLMAWEGQSNYGENNNTTTLVELEAQLEYASGSYVQYIMEQIMKLRVQEAPLDKLFAALSDDRPSRWLDQFRVRSVGDNALRALGLRYGCDPRLLIGRDVLALWSGNERQETVAALQAWWAINKNKTLAEQLGGVIEKIPFSEQVKLLTKADSAQRQPLIASIIKPWQQQPPADMTAEDLGEFLHIAGEQADVVALVEQWPIAGELRVLLSAWYLGRGNATHFDALLKELLARKPAASPDKAPQTIAPQLPFSAEVDTSGDLRKVLRIAARFPNAERLNRLMSAISSPVAGDDGKDFLTAVSGMSWGMSDELAVLWGEKDSYNSNDDNKDEQLRQAAVGVVLYGMLLQDQRLAPAEIVQQYASYNRHQSDGKEQDAKPPATDLRIADVATVTFAQMTYRLPLEENLGNQNRQSLHAMKLDFTAAKADRDAQLLAFRKVIAAIAPSALKAAGLPDIIPGVTEIPVTGTDVPIF